LPSTKNIIGQAMQFTAVCGDRHWAKLNFAVLPIDDNFTGIAFLQKGLIFL
jgi:hypothetical protein